MLLIQNKDPQKKNPFNYMSNSLHIFFLKKLQLSLAFFLIFFFFCICVKKQHDFNTLMPGGNKRPCAL